MNYKYFKSIFLLSLFFLIGCSVQYAPNIDFSFEKSDITLNDGTYSDFNDIFINSRVDWDGDETFIIKFKNLDNVYFVNSDLEKIDLINFTLNSKKFEDKESIKVYGESVPGLTEGKFELDVILVWNNTLQQSKKLIVEIIN